MPKRPHVHFSKLVTAWKKGRSAPSKSERVSRFNIVVGFISVPEVDRLPVSVRDRMDAIEPILRSRPADAEPLLVQLIKEHPDVCCLRNWLGACYQLTDRLDEALQISRDLMRDRPDYFFGRMTTVEILIRKDQIYEAYELLYEKGRFITDQVPGKTDFHVSEARIWFALCSKLAGYRGDMKAARIFRDSLHSFEPVSPQLDELDRALAIMELMSHRLKQVWDKHEQDRGKRAQ